MAEHGTRGRELRQQEVLFSLPQGSRTGACGKKGAGRWKGTVRNREFQREEGAFSGGDGWKVLADGRGQGGEMTS